MNEELARLGIEVDVSALLRLYLLVVARMVGAALPVPFFGGQLVPQRIRFGIPFFMAAFLYPFVTSGIEYADVPDTNLFYIGLLLKELFCGYCIGFVASLPFHAVSIGGSFMDTQRGTTFASVVAPLTGGHASLLGQFLNLFFVVLFLGLGGAHMIVEAVGLSYEAVPLLSFPAAMSPEGPFVEHILRHTNDVFTIGVQIAGPIVVAMFLTDATLGIVNRAAPNIQVFFLGMGIKACGGLVVLLVTIGYMSEGLARMAVGTAAILRETFEMFALG